MIYNSLFCFAIVAALTAQCMAADSVYVTINKDTVRVWDIGARDYCSAVYAVTTTIAHDTLYVAETDTSMDRTRCICTFDVSAAVTGIPSGTYRAVVERVRLKQHNYPRDTMWVVGEAGFTVSGYTGRPLTATPYQSACYDINTGVMPPYVPGRYILEQNYPNPFNPETTIRYGLPASTHVNLIVYDLLGQNVATLVDAVQSAGNHEARFSARSLAAGVYLCRMHAGSYTKTRMMHLVR